MNFIFFITILASVMTVAFTATFVDYASHPRFPGKCFYDGVPLETNQKYYRDGECTEIKCQDGRIGLITENTCGDIGESTEDCKYIGWDYRKTYPECCYRTAICRAK
ncbi:uncharacterized protein LOC119673147 [Teleopsis dalmanni]|uniref:uncharacterized protein LOC119673010 n=1 Tax=Teleopsis dalmanni TaxID=139649 RepID=UPI000D32D15A|nr:uncharacterized protein LOC119673010 [Teleopsis dalmanni]XP_037940311.1 uncharacterized protein LOC119673147 [Teleopsis dalmanni]